MTASILVVIPTRDRPEYLAILLSSLLHQTERSFAILILDSGEKAAVEHEAVSRLVDTFKALEHDVRSWNCEAYGRSEAAIVNQGMLVAAQEKYRFIYKVDDDHILPPDALSVLPKKLLFLGHENEGPILLSGITPWMKVKFKGAYGPKSVWEEGPEAPITAAYMDGDKLEVDPRHFCRFILKEDDDTLYRTQLASAANFFMRPDLRIQWADLNGSSLYADAMWFLQLQRYLKYTLYFDLSLHVWHMAASSGGVHEEGQKPQNSPADEVRRMQFKMFLRDSRG